VSIIVGKLLDREGFCIRSKVVASNHPGRTFDVSNRFTREVIRLRPVQPAVSIDIDHDPTRLVGELVHLAEDGSGSTWAVAEVDADKLPPGPLYYSASDTGPYDAAELRGIAVTAAPAMACLPPLRLLPVGMADLTQTDTLRLRKPEPFLSAVLERARMAVRERRFGDRTVVVHKPPPKLEPLMGGGYLADGELVASQPRSAGRSMVRDDQGRMVGPLEYGPPGRILSVR
jgi:hypothetical protein